MTNLDHATEQELLARAIQLATANVAEGQLPFGAVAWREGEVLATGVNTALADHDPTAHAEVEAVRAACRALGVRDLAGAIVVSSCQPCPMCEVVAASAGVSSILYAGTRELAARHGFTLNPQLERVKDLLESGSASLAAHRPAPDAEAPFEAWARHTSGEGQVPSPS